MRKIVTQTVKQTKKLGKELARTLKKGNILCLYGDLGSGKTTFTQGLAEGLSIERRIISPTFIIVRSYVIKNAKFYHIDLYRISNKNDLISLGVDQLLKETDAILAIEWAEKLNELLPKKRIDIHFKQINNNSREITINKYD